MGGIRRTKKKSKKKTEKKDKEENGEIAVEAEMGGNKTLIGQGSAEEEENYDNKNKTEDKQENGGIAVEAEVEVEMEMGVIIRKKGKKKNKKKKNYTRYKDIRNQEMETEKHLKFIEWVLGNADYNAKIPGKFNRDWRFVMGMDCSGVTFSTWLSAFHRRYGLNEGLGVRLVEDVNLLHEGEGRGSLTSVERLNIFTEDRGGNTDIPPLDLDSIIEILARLTLPSMMRAKSVCKSWNAAIGDLMNFNVESHHLVAQHIANGYHGIVLFSSALNLWFRIPLQWESWKGGRNYPGLALSAASGGLFLFVDFSSGHHLTPVVINPLTKQHKVLPDFPVALGWCPGRIIELIAEFDHFKIITIGNHQEEPLKVSPVVYNSSTNKWTKDIPIAIKALGNISNTHRWISTLHNGVVYCTNSYGLHLGCYDITLGKFKSMEIEGGLPPLVDCLDYQKNFYATLPALVMCSGKLILVGRLQRSGGERSILGRLPVIKHTLVGLWELDISANNKSWSLVSVTPQDLLQDTVKSSDGTDFQVAASDGMNQIWFILKASANMLSFNMSSMEWSMLPGCPAEAIMDVTSRKPILTPLRISLRSCSFGT